MVQMHNAFVFVSCSCLPARIRRFAHERKSIQGLTKPSGQETYFTYHSLTKSLIQILVWLSFSLMSHIRIQFTELFKYWSWFSFHVNPQISNGKSPNLRNQELKPSKCSQCSKERLSVCVPFKRGVRNSHKILFQNPQKTTKPQRCSKMVFVMRQLVVGIFVFPRKGDLVSYHLLSGSLVGSYFWRSLFSSPSVSTLLEIGGAHFSRLQSCFLLFHPILLFFLFIFMPNVFNPTLGNEKP